LLFLEIYDESGRDFPELATPLEDELAAYLDGLEGVPALRALARLDPAEDTRLDEVWREELWDEIAALGPRVQRRDLPEPPAWVGLEGLEDIRLGEEFGWAGLVEFLTRLQRLLALARKPGMEMRAGG
jgi:hypothetical protein